MTEEQMIRYHAREMHDCQKRFAGMMIEDIKSLKLPPMFWKRAKLLIKKYEDYINL
jgi:hypothetical protein